MLRIELKKHLSEDQQSKLNAYHLAGFGFLKNASSNINHVTDDHFSKVEHLGKAVMKLEGLRIKANQTGIQTQFAFKNSNNPKESWTEAEKLGWSLMLPSGRAIEGDESGLRLIEKASLTPKDLEILSKVGFVLKESKIIESLLTAKNSSSPSIAFQSKKTEEVKQIATSNPRKSWEVESSSENKKRSWE